MRRLHLLLVVVLALSALPGQALAVGGWSMYRHDARHTGRSPYFGPATPGVRWETTAGPGAAIASDGTVYIGGNFEIRAIDRDGDPKWAYPTGGSLPAIGKDGAVYVTDGGGLLALTPAGTKKWRYAVDPVTIDGPTVGPDGTIYVGSAVPGSPIIEAASGRPSGVTAQGDGTAHLYAINPNGTLKWTFGSSEIWYPPAIGTDGTVYALRGGWLYAVNPNGTKKWQSAAPGWGESPAIGSDGTIYVGGAKLYAVKPNGARKCVYTPPGASEMMGEPSIGADGTVYVGSTDYKLYAIGANGLRRWSFETDADVIGGGGVVAPPAIGADGVIYVSSLDKHLYALYPNGTKKWDISTWDPSENWTFGRVYHAPAIADDGTVYFATTPVRPSAASSHYRGS